MPDPEPLWAIKALRLSVFPCDEGASLGALHWKQNIGWAPESINRPPQGNQIIEEGAWNDCRLQVDSQRGQVHWRAFPVPSNPNDPRSVVLPPDFTLAFRALMDRWLRQHCPPVNRIAFGAIFTHQVNSQRDAVLYLDGMLPTVSVQADNSRDFIYQINRRRVSQHIEGLEINRLAKWSIMEDIRMELVLDGNRSSFRVADVMHSAQLELDVNTVPSSMPLPITVPSNEISREALPDVFNELVEAAEEIAATGDVP